MTDQEYIDAVVSMTKNGRWRDLLNPSHPDYNPKYWPVARAKVDGTSSRPRVTRIAATTPSEYPSLATQAGNLLGAIGRSVSAVVAGETLKVDQVEHDRRMAICQACEHLDAAQNRCKKCACFLAVKPWLKAESCPIEKW